MPTYVYETIPERRGEKPQQFELKQSMKDAPLTTHPTSGRRVRRVIRGGFGINTQRWTKVAPAPSRAGTKTSGGSCCGISGCGPH
jgi:hypothetical protein